MLTHQQIAYTGLGKKTQFEGSQPEWFISNIYHCWDKTILVGNPWNAQCIPYSPFATQWPGPVMLKTIKTLPPPSFPQEKITKKENHSCPLPLPRQKEATGLQILSKKKKKKKKAVHYLLSDTVDRWNTEPSLDHTWDNKNKSKTNKQKIKEEKNQESFMNI